MKGRENCVRACACVRRREGRREKKARGAREMRERSGRERRGELECERPEREANELAS